MTSPKVALDLRRQPIDPAVEVLSRQSITLSLVIYHKYSKETKRQVRASLSPSDFLNIVSALI
ncbi:hypothetical protein J6590_056243 [Homalodisca vitripennis]|nr:hypothetical protein J6590_056243 [Homalodisca vitripennis]